MLDSGNQWHAYLSEVKSGNSSDGTQFYWAIVEYQSTVWKWRQSDFSWCHWSKFLKLCLLAFIDRSYFKLLSLELAVLQRAILYGRDKNQTPKHQGSTWLTLFLVRCSNGERVEMAMLLRLFQGKGVIFSSPLIQTYFSALGGGECCTTDISGNEPEISTVPIFWKCNTLVWFCVHIQYCTFHNITLESRHMLACSLLLYFSFLPFLSQWTAANRQQLSPTARGTEHFPEHVILA